MVADFIKQTIERYNMSVITDKIFNREVDEVKAMPDGYNSMMSFMISVVDERDKLVENRAKGESY